MTIITPPVLQNLQSYNEAEVRFHIIDPALRKLGYPGGDDVYLKLEEQLDYPYFHIGHKSKKKDLPLGFPDYRAGLKGGRGSFIMEAKAANVAISQKDVEQAHSYAAHAQVGAKFFMLCNGTQMLVYETLSGPECAPIADIPIGKLDERFHELENILSPSNLAKHCQISYDTNLKLCDGLASSAKIHSGEYDMVEWAYRIFINGIDSTEILKTSVPQFAEMDNQLALMQREFNLKVAEGHAERDKAGRINVRVSFSGVTKNSLQTMKLLGIDKMLFSTNEKFLSVDPASPTVFESTADFSLDKGTMLAPLFGNAVPTGMDIAGDIFITARMHKAGEMIFGEYVALANYLFDVPNLGVVKMELDVIGRTALKLNT